MGVTVTYADVVVGASINQLAELFGMDRRTVTDRLRSLTPSGIRASHPIYRISEAAPLLLEITKTRTTRSAQYDKDFWDAQLKKQKFEENANDLWRTDKVVEVFAQVFKQFRESVTVFVDALEHESGLPADVVEKSKTFGDSLLNDCREKLLQIEIQEESKIPTDDLLESSPVPDDDDRVLADLGLL